MLELEFAYRLLFGDITCEVASSVSHGPLRTSYHSADGVSPQAVCLAIWIVRGREQRDTIVGTCVSVVANKRQESRHRAREPLAASTTEDASKRIAAP